MFSISIFAQTFLLFFFFLFSLQILVVPTKNTYKIPHLLKVTFYHKCVTPSDIFYFDFLISLKTEVSKTKMSSFFAMAVEIKWQLHKPKFRHCRINMHHNLLLLDVLCLIYMWNQTIQYISSKIKINGWKMCHSISHLAVQ